MSWLTGFLQRMAVATFPVFAPHAAGGARWCREGMRLSPDAREKKLLARLKQLIKGFRSRGLCSESGFESFTEVSSHSDLAKLPVLTKDGLIELYPALQRIYAGRSDVIARRTGGSTGVPAYHLRDRKLASSSIGELVVMLEVMGWRPGVQRLCLWGRGDEVGAMAKFPPTVKSVLSNWRAFAGYALDESLLRRFYEAVRDSPGCAVYGYTSLLEECSRVMLENGRKLKPGAVRVAWGGSEKTLPRQREMFREAFGTPLKDFYGSREFSSIAAECEQGNMHINARYIVESVDPEDYALLAPGELGLLLVTDLVNEVTPFIRYEIGDLGAVAWRDCACGRRGPCLTDLRGRTHEIIALPSGKKVHSMFFWHIFGEYPEIRRIQVVRTGAEDFEVLYTGSELSSQSYSDIVEQSRRMLGNASVRLIHVSELDRSPSGKLILYKDESR